MRYERITMSDLDHTEQNVLDELLEQLADKASRNLMRAAIYDGKNAQRQCGIHLPPYLQQVPIVLGWSAKAVDVLNRRCNLDGFTVPGLAAEDLGLPEIWDDNYLSTEAPQAGVSSLIHSTAFLISTQGDTESDEPAVVITAKDALSGTGRWNRRKRALDAFVSIIDVDEYDKPSELVLYLDGVNISMTRVGSTWRVERRLHAYGVPVEPLVYQPRLGRPFGSSRISRPVISLNHAAIRTVIRSEVTAERYSVAQRVLLGADESAFRNADGSIKPVWQAALDSVWAIPDDEDAENPRADVKEFSAGSQEPHMSQLRQQAQLFAGETSIPLASLGISGEANPTSEGSYDAGREDLIREAEGTTDGWGPAWTRTAIRGLQMLHGWDEAPAEVKRLRPKWRDPRTPSRAAAADAAAKTLDKFPWLAESELGLELYGFDQDFIDRAMVEKRRSNGRGIAERLIEAANNRTTPAAFSSGEPAALEAGAGDADRQ